MDITGTYPKAILGIDVSKKKLDCHLLPDEAAMVPARRRAPSSVKAYRKSVANTAAGLRTLRSWMKEKGVEHVHVCLEPTNTYHDLAFEELSADHWVSVVNARAVRQFAGAMELADKTDSIDAMVLAEFCRARRPVATRPLTEAQRELRELTRRRTTLVQQAQQETNRLDSTRSKLARSSIQRTVKVLAKEQARIETAIHRLIQQQDDLRQRAAAYQEVQGVGPVVSTTVLVEVPDLQDFDSPRQAVAYLGLAPRTRQSGSSLNRSGGITKRGNARVRAVLYMGAIAAIKSNPVLRAFAQRLRTAGKKPKVIIVAVMRKLVHILYAIAKAHGPHRIPAMA